MPLTCVVLAAGFSSRLGRPKQLLFVDGETLVAHAARIAREVAPVVVVIPANAPDIREALDGVDVTIVENPAASAGMASSIRCGVSAVSDDVLLTLCDQPLVTSAHLRALVAAGAAIAATEYGGALGVPAMFAAEFRADLLKLEGDVGARSIIQQHRDRVVAVAFDPAAVDIDSEADLRRLH